MIPQPPSRYPQRLFIAFAIFWIAWAIKPRYFDVWLVENALMVLLMIGLVLTRNRFPMSNISYTLIAIFLALQTIGAHYSYSEVPYNQWFSALFGRPLHEGRNHYDRLVHFCFGFFLAYPIREIFLRIAGVKGFWGYYLPLDVTMSFSMAYELIEWGYAVFEGGSAGHAFLGTQGDPWDAHKDMLLASIGALISMCIVALINWKFDKHFGDEFRHSLSIKRRLPLGEVKLAELRDETQP